MRTMGGGTGRHLPALANAGKFYSKSISSSVSSVSMLEGSATGPSFARRAAISSSVLSRCCFFFSWIFFSLTTKPEQARAIQHRHIDQLSTSVAKTTLSFDSSFNMTQLGLVFSKGHQKRIRRATVEKEHHDIVIVLNG